MKIHRQKWILLVVNVIGGIAVLGSYVHGIMSNPESRNELWGGVPDILMPWYTVSMAAAALGYFAFSYFVMFRLDPDSARIVGRFPYGLFTYMYALILAPSALWMPLSFAMIGGPSAWTWMAVRLVLFLAGLGSLGLLAALIAVRPKKPAWAHRLVVAGCVLFCIQTALLDALVWPAYFPLNI